MTTEPGVFTCDFHADAGLASLIEVFERGLSHQDKISLVYGDDRLTFGEVHAQSLSIARHLGVDCAVRPGDRAALAMRNWPEFVIAYWAATVLGAIPVALNSWWTGPELAAALNDCGATVVFADVAPDDVAAVLYTSGTTGQPKGVMITHRGAVALSAEMS